MERKLLRASSLGAIEVDDGGDDGYSEEESPSSQRQITTRRSGSFSDPQFSARNDAAGASLPPLKPLQRIGSASAKLKTPEGSSPRARLMRSHTSPVGTLRPATAIGSSTAVESAADRFALKRSATFAAGDRVLQFTGRSTPSSPRLPTILEHGDLDPAKLVSRGGLTRPKSAYVFSTSLRGDKYLQQSDGATVPFHYAPPPLTERDSTTLVKNAPKVPFATSTRDQWQRVHASVASTALAGPGAYDPNPDKMSTKRLFPTLSFTQAERKGIMDSIEDDAASKPAPYDTQRSQDAVLHRGPRAIMPTASSPRGDTAPTPGPYSVNFIEKHKYSYKFSTAPGHTLEPSDPQTASVPILGGERPKKHKPHYKFSTSPRFAN